MTYIDVKYFRRLCAVMMFVAVSAICSVVSAAGLTFVNERPGSPAVSVTPTASSGLEMVYVVRNDGALELHYSASSQDVRWERFGTTGGAGVTEIPFSHNGRESWVTASVDDCGYVVWDGGRAYRFWIVNYNNHALDLHSLDLASDQECDRTALILSGSASKMVYYTVNGAPVTLSRELSVEYSTQEYDADRMEYRNVTTRETLEYVDATFRVDAPLTSTDFTLSGDRFLTAWGEAQSVVSPVFDTFSIAVTTTATQATRDIENEQRDESENRMGGSGPVEIDFHAATSDAVVYREWQFAFDPNFDIIDLRIQENDVTHIFQDYGTTYVRFVAGDNAGRCDYVGDVYQVYVGESRLDCPNAFSPDGSEGTNDEWKVSYKSIIEFDCHIFNRWGQEMAHLTDPSQGWDGRYKGKFVPAGVYYYVIKARGTDGKDYKLSGDINIIKYKENRSRPSSN